MADPDKKTVGERINIWVQTVGIVAAGIWASYTFVYKEVFVPRSAPINTVVALEVRKETGPSSSGIDRVALTFTVSAQNPSQRRLGLFNSIWLAYGSKIRRVDTLDVEEAERVLNTDELHSVSRHMMSSPPVLVAAGRLFDDDSLESSEKVARTDVFYLPANTYDSVEIVALVPNATDTDGLDIQWTVSRDEKEMTTVDSKVYVVNPDAPDKRIEASEELQKSRDFSTAIARARIPLVPTGSDPPRVAAKPRS